MEEKRKLEIKINSDEIDTPEGIFKIAVADQMWNELRKQLTDEEQKSLAHLLDTVLELPKIHLLEIEADHEADKLTALKIVVHIKG